MSPFDIKVDIDVGIKAVIEAQMIRVNIEQSDEMMLATMKQ